MKFTGLAVVAALLLQAWSASAATLTPEQAAKHVGETTTVCGTVASAHLPQRPRESILTDLDKRYPDQIFTIVILGRDRAKFGTLDQSVLGQHLCATAPIQLYRGRPEMVVQDPGSCRSSRNKLSVAACRVVNPTSPSALRVPPLRPNGAERAGVRWGLTR